MTSIRIASLLLLATLILQGCGSREVCRSAEAAGLLGGVLGGVLGWVGCVASVEAQGQEVKRPLEAGYSGAEPEDPLEARARYETWQQKQEEEMEKRLALARCGQAEEQYWLGVMYKAGTEPAAEDPVAAYKWVSLAAKAGYGPAAETKQRYAKSLTPAQLAEAKRMVAGWHWHPGQCKAEVKGAAAKRN